MRRVVQGFFAWYERHYVLNVTVAAGLFVLQLVHLYWLSADVIAQRLVGQSFFSPDGLLYYAILVIDYTEVPALLSVSLIYINELRKGWNWKAFLFLLFLNSQWLHIFWITDEFVTTEFSSTAGTSLPGWLAWIAIMIDFLELPVIFDTLRTFVRSVGWPSVATLLHRSEDRPSLGRRV